MENNEINRITAYDFEKLHQKLANGELSPQLVLLAYQHKAYQVDQTTNAVIEFLYPNLSEINLDGPLKGIPISVKECINIKGHSIHTGCASLLLSEPPTEDCLAIKLIKDLGGIPFVRTNVVQTMMSVLSLNPLDGDTKNPLDLSKSPAGSSSGEGALISGGGSIIGIGTDIGGSIRLPAAMCGIYGFKPTTGRLTSRGSSSVAVQPITPATWGPLTKDIDGLVFLMQNLFAHELMVKHDPYIPPVKLVKELKPKLRFGYYFSDRTHVPVPAVYRAIKHVKSKLEESGHELVHFSLPFDGNDSERHYLKTILLDGGINFVNLIKNDNIISPLQKSLLFYNAPRWYKKMNLIKAKLKGQDSAKALAAMGYDSVTDLFKFMKENVTKRLLMVDAFNQAGIDVLVGPVCGMAAAFPLEPKNSFTGMLTYLGLWNWTLCPAGSMPSGLKVEEQDLLPLQRASQNADGSKSLSPSQSDADLNMEVYPTHDSYHKAMIELQVDTKGLPISVQVTALPWKDELCLHAMKIIDIAVKS
ncbi:hypothetical protein Ciccas_009042 [Cichlidogyrus casuarinus]|uniref:Amidase domain-containing protein n=1 Tax=Cichlidogyrus casuarinus TaxID=1844966 RepID=A0ABD2PYL9_9PLAT